MSDHLDHRGDLLDECGPAFVPTPVRDVAEAVRLVLAKGLAEDQQAKTLAHELAHHMLSHGHGREPGRPTEEAEAEGTAFVVCAHYGLDTSDYA